MLHWMPRQSLLRFPTWRGLTSADVCTLPYRRGEFEASFERPAANRIPRPTPQCSFRTAHETEMRTLLSDRFNLQIFLSMKACATRTGTWPRRTTAWLKARRTERATHVRELLLLNVEGPRA